MFLYSCIDDCFNLILQLSYHKFNESQRETVIIKKLQQGEVVALISDAGTPGISDPGSALVHHVTLDFVCMPFFFLPLRP